VALGGGGYAVIDVVPLVWCHVLAIAQHRGISPLAPVPPAWRLHVREVLDHEPPELMSDVAGEVRYVPWQTGYDPEDAVDRAIRATRQAAFPLLGVDVSADL